MADVRCPMCGKPNPAEAEVCRYCQARLKPLLAGSPAPIRGAGDAGSENEPEWLKQLRTDGPQSTGAGGPVSPGAPEEDAQNNPNVPDWLANIRMKVRTETPEPSELPGPDSTETPEADWMKNIQSEGSAAGSSAADAGDDWLSRLGGAESAPQPPAPSGDASTSGAEGDWASGLGGFSFDQPQPGEGAPGATPEGATPEPAAGADWFNAWQAQPQTGQEPESQPAAEAQPGEAALSGWSFFNSQDSAPAAPAAENEPAQAAPESDGQSAPTGPAGMDWLQSFQSSLPESEPQPEEGSVEEGYAAPDAELPDWLRGMQMSEDENETAEAPEGEPQPVDDSAAPAGDLPAWLSGFQGAEAEGEAAQPGSLPAEGEPSAGAEPASGAELPDWLAGAPVEQEAQTAQESGLPDWMSGAAEPQAPESQGAAEPPAQEQYPSEAVAEPAPTEPAEAALPDWFGAFAGQGAAQDIPGGEEVQPEGAAPPEGWNAPFATEAAAPEAQPEQAPSPQEGQPASVAPEAGSEEPSAAEGMPDWLSAFKEQSQAEPAAEAGQPALDNKPFDDSLPEWLEQEAQPAETSAQAAPGSSAVSADQLSQSELPSWVQAMRPIESAIPGDTGQPESEQRVEKAGPLAGMRGLIPSEEQSVQYRRPPVYTVKLQVSEKQKANAALLGSLVTRETTPKAIPQAQSLAPRVVQRIIVAGFLLFIMVIVLLMNVELTPPPSLMPDELLTMYDQINALPENSNVLVAFDYEPGLSGEMQFAATTVLDHLMRKNARLAVISTTITGPALADQALSAVQSYYNRYDLKKNVENLGYLPGGTISLLQFARDPRGAAPELASGANAWSDTQFLSEVKSIEDFSGVVVITDRAETGRAWVEQVQPFLGNVPLLFVSSAQAGPMLEPYVESGQIKGMVTGLMGDVLYGERANRQEVNNARLYWGSYQIGLLMAALLAVVGGAFSVVVSLVKPKESVKK